MKNSTVTVKNEVLQNDLKYEGVILVSYKIEYPNFKSSKYQLSLNLINKYYKSKALEYEDYIKTELYDTALRQYFEAIDNDYPLRTFEALQTFELTYNFDCILSLYFDRYQYTGGAHGSTLRASQTWNLQKGRQIKLGELIRADSYVSYILNEVKAQIEQNPDIYFENYESLIRQTFNTSSFYCTPKGIVVYYQQYDIAPYASGIREFFIPYSDVRGKSGKKVL